VERLLHTGLNTFIRRGSLRVTTAGGSTLEFGDGTGTPVAVRFNSGAALARLLLHPELRLGEAYMNGDMVLESGNIADLLTVLMSQDHYEPFPILARPQSMLRYSRRRFDQYNHRRRARRNVAPHYDLEGRL
jgi:cyclopropane-fatty-acyl-phospholipid synthase